MGRCYKKNAACLLGSEQNRPLDNACQGDGVGLGQLFPVIIHEELIFCLMVILFGVGGIIIHPLSIQCN